MIDSPSNIAYDKLATHSNPYPIYQQFVNNGGLFYDDQAHIWIASSAEVITQILTSSYFNVRPIQQPVPENICHSIIGDTFSRLIRMNDGEYHRHLSAIVIHCLANTSLDTVQQITRLLTMQWIKQFKHINEVSISQIAYHIPVLVIASLLGIKAQNSENIPHIIRSFVQSISPLSQSIDIENSKVTLPSLIQYVKALTQTSDNNLLTQLQQTALQAGIHDTESIIANAIGLLSQTYDATAGLIGNTILALSQYPELNRQAKDNFAIMLKVTKETARYDSPVQNTRRFATENCTIGKHTIKSKEAVLVLLAAANRDPNANIDPHIFNIHRLKPMSFTYGVGKHQCPGEMISLWIAANVTQTLLQFNFDPSVLQSRKINYYPSINGRIPIIPAIYADNTI